MQTINAVIQQVALTNVFTKAASPCKCGGHKPTASTGLFFQINLPPALGRNQIAVSPELLPPRHLNDWGTRHVLTSRQNLLHVFSCNEILRHTPPSIPDVGFNPGPESMSGETPAKYHYWRYFAKFYVLLQARPMGRAIFGRSNWPVRPALGFCPSPPQLSIRCVSRSCASGCIAECVAGGGPRFSVRPDQSLVQIFIPV